MVQTTTTKQVLLAELLKKTTWEDKTKAAMETCKKNGFTHNKQGKPITADGLKRLMKTMYTVGIKAQKKGWWSEYIAKADEKKDIFWVEKKPENPSKK